MSRLLCPSETHSKRIQTTTPATLAGKGRKEPLRAVWLTSVCVQQQVGGLLFHLNSVGHVGAETDGRRREGFMLILAHCISRPVWSVTVWRLLSIGRWRQHTCLSGDRLCFKFWDMMSYFSFTNTTQQQRLIPPSVFKQQRLVLNVFWCTYTGGQSSSPDSINAKRAESACWFLACCSI